MPHWETSAGNFVARLMAASCSVIFLMIWGCWGHWGYWGCWGHWGSWGSWWPGNHPVIKVQAVFDFLSPKRLLRSWRPVMLSGLLRSLRPLKFLKPLRSLKSISWWLKSPHFDVLKENVSEQNDGISSEILPSFRTEAVEDRDVIVNQIQVS